MAETSDHDSVTTTPSEARVYDALLGGSANFAADRAVADTLLEHMPEGRAIVQECRRFLQWVVAHLADLGIRQFVEIGCGLPTQGHVHHIVEARAAEQAHVVYVDRDPVAVAHARLTLEREGAADRHALVEGELVDAERLWQAVLHTGLIDPNRPVGLTMCAVLHFVPNDRDPETAVQFYRDQVAAGSYLAISHAANEGMAREQAGAYRGVRNAYGNQTDSAFYFRSRAQLRRFFGDWDMLAPGVAGPAEWYTARHVDPGLDVDAPERHGFLVGVGHKPSRSGPE